MSSVLEDYSAEVEKLVSLYRILKERNPSHEYLNLVTFDANGDFFVKPEFWKTFEVEDLEEERGLRCKINMVSNANSKLNEIIGGIQTEN